MIADVQLSETVSARFDQVFDSLQKWAPALFFGTKHAPPLTVKIDLPVRYIRVSLRGEKLLHVPRISVLSKGEELKLDPSGISASSHYNPQGLNLAELARTRGKDILCDTPMVGIHTDLEETPSLFIDVGQVKSEASLKLWNRADECAWRNWCIVVESSVDGVDWIEQYDHEKLIAAVKYLLKQAKGNSLDPLLAAIAVVVEDCIFAYMENGEIELSYISNVSERNGIPWRATVENLNRRLFSGFELEITNHGLQRTFRYWPEHQKSDYVAYASAVIENLKGLSSNVCLGYGGVLSFVRGGELMPHDDDLDILLALDKTNFPTIPTALDAASKFLRQRGYDVFGEMPSHRWVRVGPRSVVDLFVGLREHDHVSFFPGPRCEIKFEDLFPTMQVELHGRPIAVPRNPFNYLHSVYGPSWRKPDHTFSHAWDETLFADIIGSGRTAA
ncbi:hypothetical protein [Ensifer adhaerens]|uniref:hypothetical protein n=1 Tax=Ensifer adhaerens TaxID=106592 RepID=UPI000DC45718|nr:hypothetical protein [Ensifer adhaerens]RAS07182.1 hypothetical protein DEU52_11936 [Ensifer adhaerens]